MSNYLKNLSGKSSSALSEITDNTTVADKEYMESHVFDHVRDLTLTSEAFGVEAQSYTSLSAAVTAATGRTYGGIVNISNLQTVSSNLTIPNDVTLVLTNGGQISVNSGITLSIAGPVKADPYQQIFSGSGTVSFTAKKNDWISALWFNSDFVTSFNTAEVAANGNAAIRIPAGDYTLSSSTTPVGSGASALHVSSDASRSDVEIFGDGMFRTKLTMAPGVNADMLLANASASRFNRFVLRDMTFDHDASNQNLGLSNPVPGMIYIQRCSDVQIRNLYVVSARRATIDCQDCERVHINNVVSLDTLTDEGGLNAINIRGGAVITTAKEEAIVTNCYVATSDENGQGIYVGSGGHTKKIVNSCFAKGFGNGIAGETSGTGAGGAYDNWSEMTFTGNYVLDCIVSGIAAINAGNGLVPSGKDAVITGNYVDNCEIGIQAEDGGVVIAGNYIINFEDQGVSCGSSGAYDKSEWVISSNYMKAKSVALSSASFIGSGPLASGNINSKYVITGNYLVGPDTYTAGTQRGIDIGNNVRNVIISDNLLYKIPSSSIAICPSGDSSNYAQYIQIHDNQIVDGNEANSSTQSNRCAIYLGPYARDVSIKDNLCYDTRGTKRMRGIEADSNSQDLQLIGNNVKGCVSGTEFNIGATTRIVRRDNIIKSAEYEGTVTLSSGTATVNTAAARVGMNVYFTFNSGASNQGVPYVSAITAGTSFAITSTNGSDATTYKWVISD